MTMFEKRKKRENLMALLDSNNINSLIQIATLGF